MIGQGRSEVLFGGAATDSRESRRPFLGAPSHDVGFRGTIVSKTGRGSLGGLEGVCELVAKKPVELKPGVRNSTPCAKIAQVHYSVNESIYEEHPDPLCI